jgi:hypothetical protein
MAAGAGEGASAAGRGKGACLPFIFPRVAPVSEPSRTNGRDKRSAPFRLINVNANRQTHRMKKEIYVGLDVHKEWILIAVAEPRRSVPSQNPRNLGKKAPANSNSVMAPQTAAPIKEFSSDAG